MSDRVIDYNDIQFDFEGLEVYLYKKQLFPKVKLSFTLPALSYELTVIRLNKDASIFMKLNSCEVYKEILIENLNNYINDYNLHSEANNRADGVVHSWNAIIAKEHTLQLEIDFGSTEYSFLKKLLLYFSKLHKFEAIIIE